MKKALLTLLLLAAAATTKSQNLISNSDFETYSSCPGGLDEVYKATGWASIIQSPDYYNCNFLMYPAFQQLIVGAYSGTGFMGFASYGLANGAAEAIVQTLAQPLLPGNSYTVSFAAKKTNTGSYSTACGGLAVYAIKGLLPASTSGVHVSTLPDCSLLGVSPTVSNDLWQMFSFNFSTVDTVDHIIFTVELTASCSQNIFIDSTALYITPNAIAEHNNQPAFNIYPNPVRDEFKVSGLKFKVGDKTEIKIYDIMGKEVLKSIIHNQSSIINVQYLNKGVYFLEINDEKNAYREKFLKE